MSTKRLYSLTDENPDLQKQIGCMNGFFQLFDSQRFLPRRLTKGSHKRLPPPAQSSNHGMDANNALQKDKDKSLKRVVKEKQRISTESSRTSFSSSCSSSFSSLDCNKAAQLETSSFSQTIFHETPSRDLSINQQNASLQSSQHALDIRDVVKNSMHREARALSVKTATKGEAVGRGLKHIDSPRPVQPPKSAKTRVSGLNESFRVLRRPQDATWNSIEENDLKMKDAPRFSYDGRESRDILKSAIKLKELPRLSLDSKASSIRGTTSEIKSNNLLRDLQRGCGKSNKILNAQQELESCKQPSTVIAKLMGLEPPDFMSINESSIRPIKTCRDEGLYPFSRTPSRTDKNKQNRISGSPMTSQSISPQLKNVDLVKKPTPSSRFPIEPAPWMQPDVTPASQITTFRCREAPPKSSNSSPSVYSEIEKRLTELEFKKSGKDLRALKQILEAMQKTKVMLETEKEDWASNFVSESGNSSLGGTVKLQNPRNLQGNSTNSVTTKGTNSPKGIKSPIVIMKPANFIKKASNPASSEIPTDRLAGICKHQTADYAERRKESVDKRMTKNPTPRNNHLPSSQPLNSVEKNTSTRAFRSTQTSKMPKHITGKNTTNSSRGSGTVSPRLQQKKLGLEMQSRPTTPQSDLSRTRRQSSRQPTESGSPGKKFQPKSPNLQRSHYQLNEAYTNMRDLSYQGDTVSLQSESNISLVSHSDTQVTSTNRSSIRGISLEQDDHKQKNPAARLSEDRLMETPAISTLEQPSPISVLDSTFYNDDLPSPVKNISNAFNDDETQDDDDEAAWKSLELNHLTNGTKPSLGFENDQKILENIQHLVRELGQMNSTHEESMDENIASLGENTNLDHRYISEILLASGFLTGVGSGSETGHPINPNLFLALEQTKASISFSDDEFISEKVFQSKPNDKIRRKLIFDAVHEILARKLELEGSSKQWQHMVAGRRIGSQQQLLKELCSDIDQIQANNSNCSLDDEDDWLRGILREDLRHRSMDWANYQSEISMVVLDVERLIFKDLICEAVGSVAVGKRTWPDRHCRQLFLK